MKTKLPKEAGFCEAKTIISVTFRAKLPSPAKKHSTHRNRSNANPTVYPLSRRREMTFQAAPTVQPTTRLRTPNRKLRYAFYSFAAPSTGTAKRRTDFRRTRKNCLNRATASISSARNPVHNRKVGAATLHPQSSCSASSAKGRAPQRHKAQRRTPHKRLKAT